MNQYQIFNNYVYEIHALYHAQSFHGYRVTRLKNLHTYTALIDDQGRLAWRGVNPPLYILRIVQDTHLNRTPRNVMGERELSCMLIVQQK